MNTKKLVLLASWLLAAADLFSQTYSIPKTPYLDSLYSTPGPFANISQSKFRILPVLLDQGPRIQKLVKSRKGLYLNVDGTGQLYKATDTTHTQISFTRIDSTRARDYNGGSILFAYKDTIFSFGGYGIWRTNGQLRYFNEVTHEWESYRINKEYHFLESACYMNPETEKLYIIQFPFKDEITFQNDDRFLILEFDMKKKQISEKAVINDRKLEYALVTNEFKMITIPGAGLFLPHGELHDNIMDLENLKIYTYKNGLFGDSNYIPKGIKPLHTYSKGNKLYYTKSTDTTDQVFTRIIDRNALLPAGNIKATGAFASTGLLLSIGGAVALLLIMTTLLLKKRKQPKIPVQQSTGSTDPLLPADLSALEIDVLRVLYENRHDAKAVNVEMINKILGLSRKSVEVQRKVRNDTVNRINIKFRDLTTPDSELILRNRVDEDQRYIYYTLNKAFTEQIKPLIGIT